MSKTTGSKLPACRRVGIAVLLALLLLCSQADAIAAESGAAVQDFYDALLSTMKNGKTLGQSGRFAQLRPIIQRTFDISGMARLSVGPSWIALSEGQRQHVADSFARYIAAVYANRFDSYAGQKLEVIGEQVAAAGRIVHSQIVKATGEPVRLDYVMHPNNEGWLISDIYLDGAISEVATRRSEFSAILKHEGIDGLIAALNRQADTLIAR